MAMQSCLLPGMQLVLSDIDIDSVAGQPGVGYVGGPWNWSQAYTPRPTTPTEVDADLAVEADIASSTSSPRRQACRPSEIHTPKGIVRCQRRGSAPGDGGLAAGGASAYQMCGWPWFGALADSTGQPLPGVQKRTGRLVPPPNAWILFYKMQRREMVAQRKRLDAKHRTRPPPGCSRHTEMLTRIRAMWSDIGPEGRAPYEAMAQSAMDAFRAAFPSHKFRRAPRKKAGGPKAAACPKAEPEPESASGGSEGDAEAATPSFDLLPDLPSPLPPLQAPGSPPLHWGADVHVQPPATPLALPFFDREGLDAWL